MAWRAAVALVAAAAAVAMAVAPSEVQLRTHSLRPPFLEENLENRYWDFGGSTVVSTNKYIRLTPDRQSKTGWLWSKQPIEHENWAVEFEFRVDGQGTKVFGDGFAFWMTEERAQPGPAFGNKADFHGLGVFFDTYMNGRHTNPWPQVIAQVSDGTKPYNVGDDNFANRLANCEAKFRKTGTVSRARVSYISQSLAVELDVMSTANWQTCFRVENIVLPRRLYVGFTAATGDVADEHDILSVATTVVELPMASADEKLKILTRAQAIPQVQKAQETLQQARTVGRDRVSGVKAASNTFSAIVWVIVVAAIILGVVGLAVYMRMQMTRNKRF